jgi:LysR family glycine cleavage system transcriptional activator
LARRLPPFAAIRAFEAAGRHCNLRAAGEELFLSVSAVSHQVRSLEQFLGVQLFIRTHNSLELTDVGRDYMLVLAQALDLIASTTARTEAIRNTTRISINLVPSLAVLWLMPRLGSFYDKHPLVDVNIVTSLEPLGFRSGPMDMEIRYEPISALTPNSTVLFRESCYPVCSRLYAEQTGLLENEGALGNFTLIHCQTSPAEWDDWLTQAKLTGVRPLRILNVDTRALSLQAAESGLGAAMGRSPFALGHLAEGRLISLSERSIPTGFAYTLHLSDSSVRNPAVKAFAQWLNVQAQDAAQHDPGMTDALHISQQA